MLELSMAVHALELLTLSLVLLGAHTLIKQYRSSVNDPIFSTERKSPHANYTPHNLSTEEDGQAIFANEPADAVQQQSQQQAQQQTESKVAKNIAEQTGVQLKTNNKERVLNDYIGDFF